MNPASRSITAHQLSFITRHGNQFVFCSCNWRFRFETAQPAGVRCAAVANAVREHLRDADADAPWRKFKTGAA